MVNNSWSFLTVKGLHVHDVLKLIHPLRGVLHMSGQVTVEETECVSVERQTDGHATFVTLRDKQRKTLHLTSNTVRETNAFTAHTETTDKIINLCQMFYS